MPELDPRLSAIASKVLSARGIEIRTGTTIEHASAEGVKLSDGEFVPTRSLICCVGVRPDPMVARLGLPMQRGRLTVDEYLTVPGHPEIYAAGDAAAGTRPHPPWLGDRDDRTACRAPGQARPEQHRRLPRSGWQQNPGADHTGTTTSASSWISAERKLPPTRWGYGFPACPPRPSPADTTCSACRPTAPASPPTGALGAIFSRQLMQLGLIRSSAVPLTAGTPEHPSLPTTAPSAAMSESARPGAAKHNPMNTSH